MAEQAPPLNSDAERAAEERTRAWVERVVVGLELCPFAPPALDSTCYAASAASEPDHAIRFFLEQLGRFVDATESEASTSLIIFVRAFGDFEEFLDALDVMQGLLEEAGLLGTVQLASFHPLYQFEGSEEDDAANFTNRSPFPTVHLLREAMIARLVASHPDPEGIAAQNEARLRALSPNALHALVHEDEAGALKR